jgi:DNA-binding transcriptional LysR family regulator
MELRHLRYFVAVVEWRGFRGASRRLHVAQPAISQTLTHLEEEIGIKLFVRSGRSVKLTAEGEIFYTETLRTLEQSQYAVELAQRAARGEVGTLSIGFCGAATYAFLPELVRKYKVQAPGVKLILRDMTAAQQEAAFTEGIIDVGFTHPLSTELSGLFQSRALYKEPLLAALPTSRLVKGKRIKVEDLSRDRFILFHRKGSPKLFDTIIGLCNERGFSPIVEYEEESMQTALALVAAEQGVSIVPASALSMRLDGVQFLRLQPDHIRVELVIAWPKMPKSTVLKSFLDLVESNRGDIQEKARLD